MEWDGKGRNRIQAAHRAARMRPRECFCSCSVRCGQDVVGVSVRVRIVDIYAAQSRSGMFSGTKACISSLCDRREGVAGD